MGAKRFGALAICRYGNALILILFGLYGFLIPGGIIVNNLRDPGLRGRGIPSCAFHWHRALSPRYERWARARVAAGSAEKLDTSDIAGTEWPLFGSVFYLWATESLQAAWEKDNQLSPVAPKEYAHDAIEAAAALLADPKHAAWVKNHWGEDYLHQENIFYRMLLIAGLTSHYKLLREATYLSLLRDQVETLSKELDKSPYGLLDDYPGECYPTDVVAAIASIRRADAALGTDHGAFVKRSLRAFQGDLLHSTGLPPYSADATMGRIIEPARGSHNSYLLIFAPELWEDTAKEWYANYEKHFWQHRWMAVGFREFPKQIGGHDWYMDVDAGPVVAAYGVAACAFGVGAARANGRFDHGYPLTAEMLAFSWPLPDGTLLAPRILSDATEAPYLGEAAVLFCLSREPVGKLPVKKGGRLPGCIYLLLTGYFGVGLLLISTPVLQFRPWRRDIPRKPIPLARAQFTIWAILVVAGIAVGLAWKLPVGILLLLFAQFLPRGAKRITLPAEARTG